MTTALKQPRARHHYITVRGFLRGQLVNGETGKIEGDSGWVENSASNFGLTALAAWLGQAAGSSNINYAAVATQTANFNMTQTDMIGQTASFASLNLSTSGTCTTTATVSFSSTMLAASCSVGAAGLYYTNSAGSLFCGQTFATSAWNTNQNFNLTYQIRFATA
jgi:hypothetical protein